MFLNFYRLIKIITCFLIIVVSCAIGGENLVCDVCICAYSQVNCTETITNEELDLSDHSEVLYNKTLMHFNKNNIIIVKQLPRSKVKYLSFRHNKISKINNYAFSNLMYLVELDLSYNYLSSENLNPEVFKVSIY